MLRQTRTKDQNARPERDPTDLARKMGIILTLVMGVLVAAVPILYWWANTVPRRPKGVSKNAVFLWAPYVGLPAPRRGSWLNCWEENRHDLCRLSEIDGTTHYEGEFVPYGRASRVTPDQLRIDPVKTVENKVWVGDVLVPLVYLENGEVVIPASSYEESKRILDQIMPVSP